MPQQQHAKHPAPSASPSQAATTSAAAAAAAATAPSTAASAAAPQAQQQQVPAQAESVQKSSSAAVGSPSSANQSTEGRKISCEDIQLVQNLIERCLQLYMNQAEVINTLLNQAKIEPGFTSLVWQKLEEQNPDFFKAYYTRLKLKKHIMTFNHLLEQQNQLMQKLRIIPTKPPMQPLPSHSPLGQVPMGYPVPQIAAMPAPAHAHMSALPQVPSPMSTRPENFNSPQASPAAEQSGLDILQCPNSNDMTLSSSSGNGVSFPFGIGNPADMGLGLPTSLSLDVPFTSHDAQTHSLGDEDVNSSRELGALGHLPRNFSLSDLAAELGHSDLEALGNYPSPFMSPEAEGFLRSPDRDIIDDDKLLDELDFGDLK